MDIPFQTVTNLCSIRRLRETTMQLHQLEKRASYSDFPKGVDFCIRTLSECGFQRIEKLTHSADGKSSAFDCVMPQAWDLAGRSLLKIVSPEVAGPEAILADSDQKPISAAIWSPPTPPGGITGELVELEELHGRYSEAVNKWVLCCLNGTVRIDGELNRKLAMAGAAGLVVTNLALQETAPNDIWWFNGQGMRGWYHVKEDLHLPVFSISPKQAFHLKERLKKAPVILHGEMNTRIYDGEIYTVTAVIPGESDEEYALFAHIYEPFPADDALGFAIATELGRIVRDGGIKLRKTLRVVFSMELYGFAAFLKDRVRTGRITAALSLDGFSHKASKNISFRQSSISLPFFGDLYYPEHFFQRHGDIPYAVLPGTLSDDTFAGDPLVGIPTNWFYNPSGIFHHSTAEGFQPDWETVEQEFPTLATLIIHFLSADATRFASNAKAIETAAQTELHKELTQTAEAEACGKLNWFDADAVAEMWCRYQSERLKSMYRFFQMPENSALLQSFTAATRACQSHFHRKRCFDLSSPERKAANTVVIRQTAGTPFSHARVPYAERRICSFNKLLFSLFDGKRDLLTAIRLMDAATGVETPPEKISDILNNLPYLEKYGYLSLEKAHRMEVSELTAGYSGTGHCRGGEC